MAKFNARKGLAIAAATVLGVSLLTAAPAQAAGELTLVPAAGTKWSVPSTNGFGVKAYFTSGYNSSEFAKLKFKVVANGGTSVDADSSATAVYAATTDLLTGDGTLSAVKAGNGAGTPTFAAFQIPGAASTSTYSITVQAFVDTDSSGTLDAGEWTSSVETITFLKYADVDWTLDIVNPTEGATTAEARVTSSNINLAQLTTGATTSQVGAVFYDTGSILYTNTAEAGVAGYDVTTDADIAVQAMSYSATFDRLSATSTATTALAAADTIKADVFFEATATAETAAAFDIAIGGSDGVVLTAQPNDAAEATKTEAVAASKITGLAAVNSVATATNTATNAFAVSVRTGATSVVATATVTYETGVTSADVTFRVAEPTANTLVAGASISAGGKTLTNANTGLVEFIDVVVTANALGVATLNLVTAGLTNTVALTNAFTVGVTAEGLTGALTTYTVADGTAAALYNTNAVGVNDDSSELVFPVGSAFVLNYSALDTFGSPLTAAGHSVTVSDGTNSWSASVVNGVAAVTIPAYAAATTKTMSPILYKNGVDVTITEKTAEVTIGTSTAAASVTALGDNGITSGAAYALNLKASTAADTRTGASAPAVTAATVIEVAGSVKDSNLDGVATAVTVSSPGLLFEADGVWAVGSITVQSTSTGAYKVDVRSNFTGKKVVTVTSGAATITEELWFVAAADDAGVTLTLNVPAVVVPGSTLQITGSLVDAFGNAVSADGTGEDFNFTYTGPGYAGSVPTATSAVDGSFSYNVLLGANDSGTATVVVGYDLNGDGDYADTGDILVSKTVVIGSSAALVASWTKNLNDGTVKMYAKNIVGAGKVQFMLNGKEIAWVNATSAADSKLRTANGASYLVRTIDLVEGQKNVLEILVDGVRSARSAYSY